MWYKRIRETWTNRSLFLLTFGLLFTFVFGLMWLSALVNQQDCSIFINISLITSISTIWLSFYPLFLYTPIKSFVYEKQLLNWGISKNTYKMFYDFNLLNKNGKLYIRKNNPFKKCFIHKKRYMVFKENDGGDTYLVCPECFVKSNDKEEYIEKIFSSYF